MLNFVKQKHKLIIAVLVAVNVGCFAVLIPQVRAAVIYFGEQCIVHRALNVPIWHIHLTRMAHIGIAVFLPSLFVFLFWLSSTGETSPAWIKKDALYTLAEITLIGLYALSLLIIAGSNKAIWFDETCSLAVIHHSFAEMIHIQMEDVHPPLYFFILKLWSMVFGEGVFSMKMVSIIPTILTMLFVTLFLNKHISRKAAVLFLLCFAASETILHFSIEIRPYSLGLFFVTMAALSIWHIINTGRKRWWVIFLICADAAAYTHFYAAIFVAVEYIFLFFYLLLCDKAKIKIALLAALVAILIYFPWLPVMLGKTGHRLWFDRLGFDAVVNWYIFIFQGQDSISARVFSLLFEAVFFYFLYKKVKSRDEIFGFCALSCFFIVAGMGVFFAIIAYPATVARYLVPAHGLVWLFFAIEGSTIKKRKIYAFMCITLSVLAVMTFSISLRSEQREGEEYDRFYVYISKRMNQDDIFMVTTPEAWWTSGQMTEILSYLFPAHVFANSYSPSLGFQRDIVPYNEISSDEKYRGRRAWILVPEFWNSPKIPLDQDTEFCGDFGWALYRFRENTYDYRFKLYHTNNPAAIADYLSKL